MTMNRATRDLQQRAMSVRMVPLANVFRRFPRVVHDLAATLGKRISVEIRGEDTELDKQMIEQITDPLTHLIRNAVDHGIETPDQRQAAGKPAEGKIGLRVPGRGQRGDRGQRRRARAGLPADPPQGDRAGTDRRRRNSKRRATPRDDPRSGVLDRRESERRSARRGHGRGEAEHRGLERLAGHRIDAWPRRHIPHLLPLTLAIVDGLAASLHGEIYILPLLSVVESLQPKAAEIKTIAGKGEMMDMVRGKSLPLVRLHRMLHAPAAVTDPTQGLVIIVENHGKRLGLLVDELIGQMQVVMKSLEANYEKGGGDLRRNDPRRRPGGIHLGRSGVGKDGASVGPSPQGGAGMNVPFRRTQNGGTSRR